MRKHLLVTGGVQFEDAVERPHGLRFKSAQLVDINLETGVTDTLVEYIANGDNYPPERPHSSFSSAGLEGDRLYLCTVTEVLEYSYPDLRLLRMVSYPFFQDLHHVKVIGERIAVVSTGLDLLVLLDRETLEPVEFINALGKDPWHRYSQEVDYRKVVSLKPHDVHPNHVFEINGSLWLTRFIQKDAICVDDFERRIKLDVGSPHDGLIHEGRVYFTTVNGHIVQVNAKTLEIECVIDLNVIEDSPGPLGWCRGLLIENDIAYVGFTRLRETRIKENVKWALRYFSSSPTRRDTRIVAYDLENREKLSEAIFPKSSISVIYSVMLP